MAANMSNSEERIRFWEHQAQLLRTVSHPVRLTILEALCEAPRCVNDMNALVTIAQPHLSQHIAALRKAKLIACHTNGPLRCYYILKPTLVKNLIRLLYQEHPAKERDRATVIQEAGRTTKRG